MFNFWAERLPSAKFSASLEVPYTNIPGKWVATPENLQYIGGKASRHCARMLNAEKPPRRNRIYGYKKTFRIFFRKVLFWKCGGLFRNGNRHFSVRAVPLYDAVLEGEQSVVFAHSDVFAGVDFRAALTHNDVARQNKFVAEFFDAQTLCVRIASVLCAALTLFMCHKSIFLSYALTASILITESSWR